MKKSIDFLEQLSNENYSKITHLRFNNNINESTKQIKARIDILNWANEMVYFYIKKEKGFLEEFLNEIKLQKNQISIIKEGEYKKALLAQLDQLEKEINDRINSGK
ncbi:hypothetical protein [Candidatus Marinarcus aquaticus]|uniref:Uncharacterized protein n=1 Tax=Candidatus Marinarcus aquaticus TaxID=2044504 RepID=A0A4Q0XMN0_9BACT|nr:hypothetical protein [Candidatus Marinarcus aquaticus]RXJ54554.1 hypothetical protein CRV04_10990 [Candidatus Marinarcus aquaticus]